MIKVQLKLDSHEWHIRPNAIYIIGNGTDVVARPENYINIEEPGIKVNHAILFLHNDGRTLLMDLGSETGTYLDDVKLEPVEGVNILTPTAKLRFGNTEIEYELYLVEEDMDSTTSTSDSNMDYI